MRILLPLLIPQTIVAFLAQVYALFPQPKSEALAAADADAHGSTGEDADTVDVVEAPLPDGA